MQTGRGLIHHSTITRRSIILCQSTSPNDDDSKLSASHAVDLILTTTLSRVNGTTTKRPESQENMRTVVRGMLQTSIARAFSTSRTVDKWKVDKSSANDDSMETITSTLEEESQKSGKETEIPTFHFPFATRYKNHPALSNVALAHGLWASVVRPNVDTVIDATCGNGYDSVKLADLLFVPHDAIEEERPVECFSQLICLDIQQQACENTQQALHQYLNNNHRSQYQNHVKVLHASHEVLPHPTNTTSVGLVVYNLGYLPANRRGNGKNWGKDCVTVMDTTVASLSHAASMLRVGGMISVVTYPATGPIEDQAVRLLLECMALLSSNTRTWQEAVSAFTSREDGDIAFDEKSKIAYHVTQAMNRILIHGPDDQTWRVSQHEKLGMDNTPILVTATRIK